MPQKHRKHRDPNRKRPAEEGGLQDIAQESGTPSKRHNPGPHNPPSDKAAIAPSSEHVASARDIFTSSTPHLAPARQAPIKTKVYKATLERLDGILVKGNRTCTSSCKHRGESHRAEEVTCNDPNCKTIGYHKDCLREEVRAFCGRSDGWICDCCFFERQREFGEFRESETPEQKAKGYKPGGSSEGSSSKSTISTTSAKTTSIPELHSSRDRDLLAVPRSEDAAPATAGQSSDNNKPRALYPHYIHPDIPPVFCRDPPKNLKPRLAAPTSASANELEPENESQSASTRSEAADQPSQTPNRASSAGSQRITGHDTETGATETGSIIEETHTNNPNNRTPPQKSQTSAGHNSTSSAADESIEEPGNPESLQDPEDVAIPEPQQKENRIQAGVRERHANFRFADPEVFGWSYRVSQTNGIEKSAKAWTTENSSCNYEAPGIVIKYKHDEDVPGSRPSANEPMKIPGATAFIKCCSENNFRGRAKLEVPVRLLLRFSPSMGDIDSLYNGGKLFNLPAFAFPGTIDVGRIDANVVDRAISFLMGETLEVKLPGHGGHIAYAAKKAMLQMADFAHKLDLECLKKAAMHAICVSILRDPTDWKNDDTRELAKKTTWEGNPANDLDWLVDSIVLDNPYVLQMLTCGKQDMRELCEMPVESFVEGGRIQWGPSLG